jgi:predicted NACHT family NTPase
MERSRKLTLSDWTKANNALNLHFEGNKSKLTKHLDMSRTTVTAFFSQKPVREAEFRKICLALRLNWQEVLAVSTIASTEENWIEEVRSRCREKILYQHGKIQLLNQTEIGVDQLYVDVWLLDRSPRTFQVSESTLLQSFDLREDRLGLGDRIKRNEGMAVANENAKLLILGKPGAGKTTFLKHLAVDCSNGKFQPVLIPVLIELRRIQPKEWKLLDAISAELEVEDQEQTQKLLMQGKLLILMDGLDEVLTSNFRRNVQEQVRSLAEKPQHKGNRFILTCRTQIIDVIPQGFTSVEVADFNEEQVEKFVKNWFRVVGRTAADIAQQWQTFSDATKMNPALNELTVTPVLLSLMCLVLQDEGDLPAQMVLLYRKGVRLLLEKWNDRKEIVGWEVGKEAYRKLGLEQKEALLIEIAARKFENPDNFLLFEQKDLAKQIANFLNLANAREGEAVLKAIEAQHGLLVERADELWSFSHLTFQEYFTAHWLNQLQQDAGLAEKIADQRWRELVKLAIKSQQPADRLLRLIKRAIDCSILKDAKLQKFLIWIWTKTDSIQTQYNSTAIRAYYFARTRTRAHALHFALNLVRDLNLKLVYDLNLAFVLDLNRAFALALALALALDLDLNLVRALEHNHYDYFDLNLNLVRALDCNLVPNRSFTSDLDRNLNIDSVLINKLEKLRTQLPECSTENWHFFQRWWERNGQLWTAELHQVITEHQNNSHDWRFNEAQQQALQRYYDANKFLVELLQQPGAVSDTLRQEIEDNLLLPIATLQERQPEMYGE